MDAYEATKMVYSRIQALDPDNAATVMGFLLIQDPGQQEMIRLAFGPDSLLRTVITNSLQKHQQQGAAAAAAPPQGHYFPPPSATSPTEFDDDQLCGLHNAVVGPRGAITAATAAATDGGRCLYFLRGYCKNGPSCRFFHHGAIPPPPSTGGGINNNYYANDSDEEGYYAQQQQRPPNNTTLLGSPRLTPTAQQQQHLGSPLAAPSPKSLAALNHLLRLQQLQHQRRQRAEDEDAAAAAAALRLLGMRGANQQHAMYPTPDMLSPASRQIYLTFPADSTFTEEDVSNYFSIYGPVQDVRIPYQQKRMFGFVSFVYPETVRMVLAKGNPHFVCDSRVLVKPYKEKPKIRENNRKPLMAMMSERSDFSDDPGYHQLGFHPLEGSRMLFGGGQDASILLRRKIEEEQQAAAAAANVAALQQAIELQRKRFTGLEMLDLNNHRDAQSPPVSSYSPKPVYAPSPIGTTSSGFTTAAAAVVRPSQHLSCNGTDQANCFTSSGIECFSTEALTTFHSTASEGEPQVADILNGGSPEEEDASQSTHDAESGLPNGEGRDQDHTALTESPEQDLAQMSLIHKSLSTISEELELLNIHHPPTSIGFQMPRFSAGGRGAV